MREGTMSLRTPRADIVPLTLVRNPPLSVPPPFEDARFKILGLLVCAARNKA